MAIVMRALVIGLAAVAALWLMSIGDDGEGGANIGAGLAVFAVLVVGGFTWALFDGLDLRRGARPTRPRLGTLLLRWALVSGLTVAVVVAAMTLRDGSDYLADVGPSTVAFLVLLVLVPAAIGAFIGWVARRTTAAPGQRRSS